jgi:hypothetical protein
MVALLIIGLGVLASGLFALVYSIPIKDFSFGNTLIVAGTVAACSGLILVAAAVVVRQLQRIAQRIEALSVPLARGEAAEPALAMPSRMAPPAPEPPSWPRPETMALGTVPADAAPEPVAPRSAPPSLVPEPVAAPDAGKGRRNLLFVSSRRERERSRVASGDPVPPGAYSELKPPAAAPEAPVRQAAAAAPLPPSEPVPAAVVVKSGAVDGMAYSLYSDGSIEAQLPEGMMRFASISELRAHLERKP